MNAIQMMNKFPEKLANELVHCILAHHGELEYGSPKKPATAEAMALHFADNTDAKMQTMTELLSSGDPKVEWLGYQRLFESNIMRSTKAQ
jgi:3'-5' exoribonuclease